MANPYETFVVDMVDVSTHQDNPGTVKKPDVQKLVDAGFMVLAVRAGYGLVKDGSFDYFWSAAKGKLQRKAYWYGDYYSHRTDPILAPQKITDYAWGAMQAPKLHTILHGDYGEAGAVVWDAEESPYGWRMDLIKKIYYNRILKGFYDKWKELTGQEIEIYCSPAFIKWLDDWVKDLTLWVAWYDRTKTKAQIIAECRARGWRGKILFWQYASDGDINFDGVSDGIDLGMETETLDLNAWLGTLSEWSQYCGSTPPIVTPPVEDPPVVVPPASSQMKVIAIDGLNIRNTPKNLSGSYVYSQNGTMPCGTVVDILETKVIGYDVWHRIGYMQWCAERYNGTTFLGGV